MDHVRGGIFGAQAVGGVVGQCSEEGEEPGEGVWSSLFDRGELVCVDGDCCIRRERCREVPRMNTVDQ